MLMKNTKNEYFSDYNYFEYNYSEVENKIPSISDFVAATVFNTKISEVEEKTPGTSSFMTTIVLNTKISEVENKILDNSKHITTQELDKLTAEKFVGKLRQADLVGKADFDDKLIGFNKQITSNKTKHLEVKQKLNSLITKGCKFLLGGIYFKA